jgi:hypothetical protein
VEVVANEMMMLSDRSERRDQNNASAGQQGSDVPPDEIAANEDEFPF